MNRRGFLIGATATLVTAPAIVRAASLMPVRVMPEIYGISPALNQLQWFPFRAPIPTHAWRKINEGILPVLVPCIVSFHAASKEAADAMYEAWNERQLAS